MFLDIVDVEVQRLAQPNSSSTGRSAAHAADVEQLPPVQEGERVAGVGVAAAEEEVEGKAQRLGQVRQGVGVYDEGGVEGRRRVRVAEGL